MPITCQDYGFECDFHLAGRVNIEAIKRLRNHFEEEHGIDYPVDAVIQMVVNKGHSLESIKKTVR